MLNQIGCSVKIESSWMKIVKGSEVIKKGNTLQENWQQKKTIIKQGR